MKNIVAILKKQVRDTLKNKTILIQFLMFPVMTLVMNNAVKFDEMPPNFFVQLFATMYVGMAPLTSMAAVISEEKEKGTLRVLLMSNVKPFEYLIGVGSYVWLACMIGAAVICAAGSFEKREIPVFMLIMAVGILVSLLVGAAIGTWSKTQMMATSLSVPIMLVLSFLPMLSLFNETIAAIAKFLYTEQMRILMDQVKQFQLEGESVIIIGINIVTAMGLFVFAYRKSSLA